MSVSKEMASKRSKRRNTGVPVKQSGKQINKFREQKAGGKTYGNAGGVVAPGAFKV